ncbi:MAG: hypothetical protein JG777_3125 [Clostridia bacterium]|jgi:hypothetical protein|nr:hypothetical protein [Clostridia bacterium]
MDASLDTDIIIHLYKSNKRDLLFSFFNNLYMYEYLVENELKRKAYWVYEEFLSDVERGLIKTITNSDLIRIGIKGLFKRYIEDYNYLFDMGELHAVALAKAMGIVAFLSDDTKEFGPYETLVKELIEDVIPFAFYELLFLKYLESKITVQDMLKEFEEVNTNSMNQHPMNFKTRMSFVGKRFSKKYGTNRDRQWIENFCSARGINFNSKMLELKNFLKSL